MLCDYPLWMLGLLSFFLTPPPHKKTATIGTWYQSLRFFDGVRFDSPVDMFSGFYVIFLCGRWGFFPCLCFCFLFPDLQGTVAVQRAALLDIWFLS